LRAIVTPPPEEFNAELERMKGRDSTQRRIGEKKKGGKK
jgi:hypothetical protein